jgi:hypothetical protein
MTTITIALTEERAQKPKEFSSRFHVSPEDLVRLSLEEILTRPDDAFQRAAEYVIAKNAELYRRLS